MIHVFLGTKAQYIKTAPLLRLLDAEGIGYRLIDSGQHAALSVGLREELGVRHPDHVLASGRDITSIPQAARWALKLFARLLDGRKLRREVFGGQGGVCVVHGDTPSTLLSTLMARRAGLQVAHLEAGLRSKHLLHPFPEELIRVIVMRIAHLLFAPDAEAVANLRRMRVKGRIVPLPGNTVAEALAHDLRPAPSNGTSDAAEAEVEAPVIVTMHRVENLNRRERVEHLVSTVERIAVTHPVRFVQHGPTIDTLKRRGLDQRLRAAGVELVELAPHAQFVAMLQAAPFVITDGGSIQEECALLGVPTLLWRAATERADGIGANVVVSDYDRRVVDAFLAEPQRLRRPAIADELKPSEVVLEHLRNHA
ncbi:UDP-N-acetylglucosamine 2-epimerase [Egicoccus sp. AB-alg6-2]|uniref:UDP-N-acetylglucosamine 2-epimerase n=1 Tax=Egicoccus sp. AB-alg6-2 TaxID=3242692 RepID=UPI00359D68B8